MGALLSVRLFYLRRPPNERRLAMSDPIKYLSSWSVAALLGSQPHRYSNSNILMPQFYCLKRNLLYPNTRQVTIQESSMRKITSQEVWKPSFADLAQPKPWHFARSMACHMNNARNCWLQPIWLNTKGWKHWKSDSFKMESRYIAYLKSSAQILPEPDDFRPRSLPCRYQGPGSKNRRKPYSLAHLLSL